MKIEDFCDMKVFEAIMSNWATCTGLATVAVGADGKYISACYNFTEFCIDLTRGSIIRQVLLFALPLCAGNILQQLYTTVDTLVIGNYCSS